MKKLLALVVSFLMLGQVYGANLQAFKERFEFVREDGKLMLVRDKSITTGFNLKLYVEFIKELLIKEQALMNTEMDYDQQLRDIFAEKDMSLVQNLYGDKADIELIVDSMKELKGIDFEAIFANKQFKDFVTKVELKLKDVLLMADPRIMANVSDSAFFYKKNVTYQVMTWALSLAKKMFSQVPMLNTASYVVKKMAKMFADKRLFHQNMLLHYLEKFPAEELGITHEEANLVFSSIYESRIPWFAFWESSAAKANWSRYGTSKFFQNVRMVNNNFRTVRRSYDSVGKRLNYGFQNAVYKGRNVVLNLFDKEYMFSKKPSIAMELDSPKKVKRMRTILHLAGLGSSFLPLPSWIKDIAQNFIKSFYEKQQLTEGALVAHFEVTEEEEMIKKVVDQYLNPFDSIYR